MTASREAALRGKGMARLTFISSDTPYVKLAWC